MRDYQKYATIVAVFAAVLYAALVVAAFGMISLLTNRDVIIDPNAGLLVGPSMTAAASLVVFLLMLLLGLRSRPENQRIAVGYALGTGFAAFAAFVLVGTILFALNAGLPADSIAFAGSVLLGPFAATAGIIGFIVTLVYSMVLASRMPERGRPLWPWERRDD
ncbi:hypothetical protein E3T26_07385 [Cryobacterium sp. TMT1-21]|uniref:DUF6121 family protein n=1 Tax=unclassified Cryobacterium TaxID=2649013 RepID=UPI00106A7422|nr:MULTISPECIES: DUF6121 family protein [unclassified Cryobacterium]TFD15313.1 hypothetical protein E3T26_07385 [Cryobacterium sp. TMT1-21]TFD17174.1 hypothetical protein E3T32_14300 [Cryobacterium sp. TMT2-23]